MELWRLGLAAVLIGQTFIAVFVFGVDTNTQPMHWTVAFGTSRWLSPDNLLVMRTALAIFFAIMWTIYIVESWAPNWFYMLTRWSVTAEMVWCIMAVPVTHQAVKALKAPQPEAAEQPALVSATYLVWCAMVPASFSVVVLYWALERPVWKLCIFQAQPSESCEELPTPMSMFVHLFDFLIILPCVFVWRIPLPRKSVGWFVFFGMLYTAWSALLFLVLGDPEPLYEVLDWSKPERTLKLAAIVGFVAVPAIALLFVGVEWLRANCFDDLDDGDGGLGCAKPMPLLLA